MLSSDTFIVFIFRLLIHFNSCLHDVMTEIQLRSFHVEIHLFQYYSPSFQIEWTWHPCKNPLATAIWIYCWTLNSVPLVYMSILMQVPHCFDYSSIIVSCKIRKWVYSNFVLFFKTIWTVWDPLKLHVNFRIRFSISSK